MGQVCRTALATPGLVKTRIFPVFKGHISSRVTRAEGDALFDIWQHQHPNPRFTDVVLNCCSIIEAIILHCCISLSSVLLLGGDHWLTEPGALLWSSRKVPLGGDTPSHSGGRGQDQGATPGSTRGGVRECSWNGSWPCSSCSHWRVVHH